LPISEGALWPYIFETNKKDKSAPCPFSLDPNHVHGRGRTHVALIQKYWIFKLYKSVGTEKNENGQFSFVYIYKIGEEKGEKVATILRR